MKVYGESDLKSNLLENATVAVLGYGNQGRAHALNLRDSGINVAVGAKPGGRGWEKAAKDGFHPLLVGEAVREADFVSILLPDEIHGEIFETQIKENLKAGAALAFAHGFTVAFGEIGSTPGRDVILVAPKGQGSYLRRLFLEGKGLPCLIAVEEDASGKALEKALSFAQLIGCLRSGAIVTTFREEAVTDLFGEQVVLCGGVPELIKTAFQVLISGGYQPEIAYIECLHELKIITDLMQEGGISYMRSLISKTAAWGSFNAGGKIVTADVEAKMHEILDGIESGSFAKEWMKEAGSGQKRLAEFVAIEQSHPIEKAGASARSLMPNLDRSDR